MRYTRSTPLASFPAVAVLLGGASPPALAKSNLPDRGQDAGFITWPVSVNGADSRDPSQFGDGGGLDGNPPTAFTSLTPDLPVSPTLTPTPTSTSADVTFTSLAQPGPPADPPSTGALLVSAPSNLTTCEPDATLLWQWQGDTTAGGTQVGLSVRVVSLGSFPAKATKRTVRKRQSRQARHEHITERRSQFADKTGHTADLQPGDTVTLTKSEFTQPLLKDGTWTWNMVNLPVGSYTLLVDAVSHPDISGQSSVFHVTQGSSTSCLTRPSPSASPSSAPTGGTTGPQASSSSSSKSVGPGTIAAAVILSLLGVVLIVFAVLYYRRRQQAARSSLVERGGTGGWWRRAKEQMTEVRRSSTDALRHAAGVVAGRERQVARDGTEVSPWYDTAPPASPTFSEGDARPLPENVGSNLLSLPGQPLQSRFSTSSVGHDMPGSGSQMRERDSFRAQAPSQQAALKGNKFADLFNLSPATASTFGGTVSVASSRSAAEEQEGEKELIMTDGGLSRTPSTFSNLRRKPVPAIDGAAAHGQGHSRAESSVIDSLGPDRFSLAPSEQTWSSGSAHHSGSSPAPSFGNRTPRASAATLATMTTSGFTAGVPPVPSVTSLQQGGSRMSWLVGGMSRDSQRDSSSQPPLSPGLSASSFDPERDSFRITRGAYVDLRRDNSLPTRSDSATLSSMRTVSPMAMTEAENPFSSGEDSDAGRASPSGASSLGSPFADPQRVRQLTATGRPSTSSSSSLLPDFDFETNGMGSLSGLSTPTIGVLVPPGTAGQRGINVEFGTPLSASPRSLAPPTTSDGIFAGPQEPPTSPLAPRSEVSRPSPRFSLGADSPVAPSFGTKSRHRSMGVASAHTDGGTTWDGRAEDDGDGEGECEGEGEGGSGGNNYISRFSLAASTFKGSIHLAGPDSPRWPWDGQDGEDAKRRSA